jgi:hypothetical protein
VTSTALLLARHALCTTGRSLRSFLTTKRVSCRAAGKRTQPEWMWIVAERVCTKLEKCLPCKQYTFQARRVAQPIASMCTVAKPLDAHAALAGITRTKPVSTCRQNKPNLIYPPACTVGAGLVVPSCVQGAPGSWYECKGSQKSGFLVWLKTNRRRA